LLHPFGFEFIFQGNLVCLVSMFLSNINTALADRSKPFNHGAHFGEWSDIIFHCTFVLYGQACVIVVIAKGRNNDNNAGLTPFYAGKTLGEGPG